MVTSPEPVLVSVTVSDAEVPTVMAKAMAARVALSSIVGGAALPYTVTTTTPLEAGRAAETRRYPGSPYEEKKVTEKVRFCPAAIVMGRDRGLALNPAPVTLGC